MAALEVYHAGTCHGCGLQLSETTDPNHDPGNPQREARYVVGDPTRCHACTAIAQRQARDEKDGIKNQHALIYPPVLTPVRRQRRG